MLRHRPLVILAPLLGTFLITTLVSDCASGTAPEDPRCGDGVVDDGESCDGSAMAGHSCDSLGFGTGTLACNDSCGFDTSGCGDTTCGNLLIDPQEECDDLNLNGASCVSLGFDGGALTCSAECTWDTSGCTTVGCGNGIIESGEQCDDGNTAAGDGCDAACRIEAGWACSGQPSECTNDCGNGVVDVGEDCDGANLGGATCTSLGFNGGTLTCADTCQYDVSQCEGDPCGNGALDTGEECDGANLDGQDCTTIAGGFTGGTLACTAGCTFDTLGCTTNVCGNDNRETGEECDGPDLGGADCVSLGYVGGSLACRGDCTFDETGCSASSTCGNGTVEGSEQCDDGNTVGGDGCSGSCQWETACSAGGAIPCGGSVSGNLLFAANHADFYACGTRDATSGDNIYSFTPSNSGVASAFLDVTEDNALFGANLDLYVLQGACNEQLCVSAAEATGDDSASFSVTAGVTYFLVVELDYLSLGLPPSGEYSLSLTCP